jgi:two-component system chemotaxis response regulator CheB
VTAIPSLAGRIDAVVIGASAGGVDALGTLLPALPRGVRAVLFVVLHLPRSGPSLLVEIFQPRCLLPVCEANDKMVIEPGTVYFAPPDYHLLVEKGGTLALSADDLVNFSRPSVDVLFESAAEVYRERLLGIVLTGASHDGAAGLEAVAAAGGFTVVQDPRTAQARVMAEAALRRRTPDLVLPLDGIAALLASLDDSRDDQVRTQS